MNDIVLSSLLNLFALYNATEGTDKVIAEEVIKNYLSHHFGLKNTESFLEFYNNLLSFYEETPQIDRISLTKEISDKVKEKISSEDRILIVLRFFEIQKMSHAGISDKATLKEFAKNFEVDEPSFDKLYDFAYCDSSTESVKIIPYGGSNEYIKTIYFKDRDLLLFIFNGKEEIKYNDVTILPGSFMTCQRSGVITCHNHKPLYYYNLLAQYKEKDDSDRTNLKLRGNNINFRFAKGIGGIHNFTFNLYGGELVAIMGGSGTGKTTLLSLLNGSIKPQEGKITINGHSIDEPRAKVLIGNVPQDDLLIEELTVYENLMFTAKLCFAGMSEQELDVKVMNMLHDLGLEAARDLKVGSPIKKYISGGQRKRLNIALELIREPDVLFLDEPTSGLSSADTNAVVNLLREQAYKGKLIIANIHQPSSDVYKMFDRLWVLDVGGYPVFDGNPIEAITYFKRAAAYADSQSSACPTCGNVDSEVILEIIDEKVINDKGVITDKRKKTPQEWHEMYLKGVSQAKDKVEELPESEQHRPSALKQMLIFLHRNIKAKITDKQWLLITLLEAPILAIICAILTHYTPIEGYTIMDNKNLVSFFFMAIIVSTFLGMSGSAEEIIKDRALLKREKFLNLSYKSYIWSKVFMMAGVALVQTLLFTAIGNIIMGIECIFFKWWLILFVTEMLAAIIGLLLSQWLSSVVAIYITIPILLIPQILLCGLVVKFPDLTPESKTGNVPVIGDVIPSRWAFEALAVTYFTDNNYEKDFFNYDQTRYEARYYESAYLHEMKSQLESMKDKAMKGEPTDSYMEVLHNSMPLLMDVCGWEPYTGEYTYDALSQLFDEASDLLFDRSQIATKASDRKMESKIKAVGSEKIIEDKRNNYNLQLERQVVNSEAEQMYKVVNGYIVADAGFIYIKPITNNGRAPFFSSVKIVGNYEIKTLWFNLGILLLMSILCIASLLSDFPGRYIRK